MGRTLRLPAQSGCMTAGAGTTAVDDADRFRLLGKYRTPRVRVGRFVRCLIHGEM